MRIGIYRKIASLAVIVCLLMTLFVACGQSESPNAQLQSAQQQQSQEKEPEKLKSMEGRLENLIELLGGPSVKLEEGKGGQQGTQQKGTQQQSTKQGSQQQSTKQGGQQGSQQQSSQQGSQQGSKQGTQQGTKQQGTKQQGTKQQGTQQQGTKQQGGQQGKQQNKGTSMLGKKQQETAKWTEIDTQISNLHYQWNDFMPEIAKKGADMKLVDNFDNALNDLTTTSKSKDMEKTLAAANTLYSYIPDIYSLYRAKMSPEVKRMIFYTRSIVLDAAKDNWDEVKKNNTNMEKSWALFKNTLEKEQKQISDKLDFSIYEMKKVSESKDKSLTDIKGRIVLANIKELEKSFEEMEKKKK